MKQKYFIQDWAGNRMHYYGEFESFEDAWGALCERFDSNEEDLEEFCVIESEVRGDA